jgi:hypothetical protein
VDARKSWSAGSSNADQASGVVIERRLARAANAGSPWSWPSY